MRSTRGGGAPPALTRIAAMLLIFVAALLSGAAPEKHLSVYSSVANYSLPIVQRQGHEYVGLLNYSIPSAQSAQNLILHGGACTITTSSENLLWARATRAFRDATPTFPENFLWKTGVASFR